MLVVILLVLLLLVVVVVVVVVVVAVVLLLVLLLLSWGTARPRHPRGRPAPTAGSPPLPPFRFRVRPTRGAPTLARRKLATMALRTMPNPPDEGFDPSKLDLCSSRLDLHEIAGLAEVA